jgi:hypothetical protein
MADKPFVQVSQPIVSDQRFVAPITISQRLEPIAQHC